MEKFEIIKVQKQLIRDLTLKDYILITKLK